MVGVGAGNDFKYLPGELQVVDRGRQTGSSRQRPIEASQGDSTDKITG
jgi:hypothetical protein